MHDVTRTRTHTNTEDIEQHYFPHPHSPNPTKKTPFNTHPPTHPPTHTYSSIVADAIIVRGGKDSPNSLPFPARNLLPPFWHTLVAPHLKKSASEGAKKTNSAKKKGARTESLPSSLSLLLAPASSRRLVSCQKKKGLGTPRGLRAHSPTS